MKRVRAKDRLGAWLNLFGSRNDKAKASDSGTLIVTEVVVQCCSLLFLSAKEKIPIGGR